MKNVFSKIAKIGEEVRQIELSREVIKVELAELSDLRRNVEAMSFSIESSKKKAAELVAKARELDAELKSLNSARGAAIKISSELFSAAKKLGLPANAINSSKEYLEFQKVNDQADKVSKQLYPLVQATKK
jgi:crotonobetainyl-CoA:carnitine CoA-transferase CaiB-like acyl-CoA transferase